MIVLFGLAFLILSTVAAFYGLQQFVVYDESGVTLQFSAPEEEAETPAAEAPAATPDVSGMQVTIVYRDPDFSQVSLPVGEDLPAVKAGYVSYYEATDPLRLTARITELQTAGYSDFIMDLKTASGTLAWASQSGTAIGYGTNGLMDYTETLAALHEQGAHVSARISVCADNLLAVRNWPLALRAAAGTPYVDSENVFWLDPYNRELRLYIIDLIGELAAQGFDEIILDDLYHPISDQGFSYSVTLHTEASPRASVGQLAVKLAEAAQEYDIALSVCVDGDSLRYDLADQTGQDLELFWRVFDRIYCSGSRDVAASDRDQALSFGGSRDRFVPICAYEAPEGFDSYVVYIPEEN